MCRSMGSGQTQRSVKPTPYGFVGSNPTSGRQAEVAQLAEHVIGNDGVTGSNPVLGSTSAAYSGLSVNSTGT